MTKTTTMRPHTAARAAREAQHAQAAARKASNPLARAIARVQKAQPNCPAVLAALHVIAARIDVNSGSPTFTSDEHDTLVALLARYPL